MRPEIVEAAGRAAPYQTASATDNTRSSWLSSRQSSPAPFEVVQLGGQRVGVQRHIHRGELEARREPIASGLRWLVHVDPPEAEAGASSVRDRSDDRRESYPPDQPDIVSALLRELETRNRELEARNREIAALHASLAATVDRLTPPAMIAGAASEAAGSSVSNHGADQDAAADAAGDSVDSGGIWAHLRQW